MYQHKGKKWSKLKDLSSILVEDSKYSTGLPRSSFKVKNQLIKHGMKEHLCENCGLTEWMNVPIALELHHINGDRFDNRLENLKVLCPNCHAMTDNYRKRK